MLGYQHNQNVNWKCQGIYGEYRLTKTRMCSLFKCISLKCTTDFDISKIWQSWFKTMIFEVISFRIAISHRNEGYIRIQPWTKIKIHKTKLMMIESTLWIRFHMMPLTKNSKIKIPVQFNVCMYIGEQTTINFLKNPCGWQSTDAGNNSY